MSVPMSVMLVVTGGNWEGEGVKEIQRRCLKCDLPSPGSSVSKRLRCWRAVQFLVCAHIKAACILQEFCSEGHWRSWFLEAVMQSCGHAHGRAPCPVPVRSWLLPEAEASALPSIPLPSCSWPGRGLGWCWGKRVSCALLRLTVQLRP